MFSQLFNLALVAPLAIFGVSALVVPRSTPPPGWATSYLEDYTVYHTRYLALKCQSQHGTAFFDACCHPMLATESLATARPAECVPSASASSSASAAEPTSTVVPDATVDEEDDCDDEDDGSDDDDEDCDDEDDDTTSVAIASTSAVVSSSAVVTVHPTTVASSSAVTSVAAVTSSAVTSAAAPSSSKASSTHTQAPTTTAVATSTLKTSSKTSSSKAPSSTSSVQSGGVATFFFQNGVAGACGTVHPDSAFVAAIDSARYGDLGATSSLCGKQVKITNTKNYKSVTVTIADACPTCLNSNSIDLSVGAFTAIATEDEGEVPITWTFI